MRRWYANGDTKTMVEDQQKELDWWREAKDMAAKEKWDDYWAAWDSSTVTGRRERKRQKEEKTRHKKKKPKQQPEMTGTEIRDYVRSEEDSSMDPTYVPSRKELRRADEEGDK